MTNYKELRHLAIGVFTIAFSGVVGILVAGYLCSHLFKLVKFSFSFL